MILKAASVKIHILACNQLYRHIVDSRYLLVDHYRLEQRFYAETALHKGMLGDKERDSAFPQAHRIAVDHVVSHNLDILAMRRQ